MTRVQRSALVPYSVGEMYDLVADVERYGEFLPWCGGARILERDGESVVAQVDIAFKGVHKSFTTQNRLQAGERITMGLKQGPFSRLQGHWLFTPLGEEASKIALDLEFDFDNRLLRAVVGPVFNLIANGLVDAFQQRARQLYGERSA